MILNGPESYKWLICNVLEAPKLIQNVLKWFFFIDLEYSRDSKKFPEWFKMFPKAPSYKRSHIDLWYSRRSQKSLEWLQNFLIDLDFSINSQRFLKWLRMP